VTLTGRGRLAEHPVDDREESKSARANFLSFSQWWHEARRLKGH